MIALLYLTLWTAVNEIYQFLFYQQLLSDTFLIVNRFSSNTDNSQEIEEEEDEGLSPARGNNNNRGGRGHSGGVGSGGGGNMYYNARK